MAERISGLSIGFDLETAGLDRSLADDKRTFRRLNTPIKTNSNNLRDGEKSVESDEKGIDALKEDIVKQRKNMDDLKAKYEPARQQDGENARSTQRLAMEYNKQADSLNRMEHQLANYTKELNEMRVKRSSWYKMVYAMHGFGDKLEVL